MLRINKSITISTILLFLLGYILSPILTLTSFVNVLKQNKLSTFRNYINFPSEKTINRMQYLHSRLIQYWGMNLNYSLKYLPELIYCFKGLDYKFLIFIDDITLDNSQNEFKLFKSILDGSLISDSQNVKFYVTSNLRHLSNKDPIEENIDEITKKENYSNIVSLSDRFGIRLGFFENNKENYLKIVQHYAEINGINLKKEHINKASEWSLEKGNFSGRTAYQFILTLKKN